ncbi:NADH-dependent [FeFe] hydrogenase, group A6 [Photobacterium lipolyticum]|uniref:Ferredoxin n=1 Tax=Photobacterium lipolyticum TaxID=266810 RepID=A0A2T3N486_9GAMM|nr:NADH-dependent [FeFe] hydrogenase, group A6 [Photobacterium lipolyticum]PSW07218.1 ferredoxin [Photobacterium lipolyticum]
MLKVTINGKEIVAGEGTTILEAAKQAAIHIPTLCFLEKLAPTGACRVCLVEIEGARNLMAACSTPVADGMRVMTHSPKVRDARRKVVELILSEHEGNCQICDRNEDCDLQQLAAELGLKAIRYQGEKAASHIDDSTPALLRDNGKCIKCRRCVTVCSQVQSVGALYPQGRGFETVIGPAFALGLNDVACVQCGQCAAVCPVGAISERNHVEDVWKVLEDPQQTVVVQTAPAIRAALGECFGCEPGTLVTGKMTSALRQLGFDGVFDTNFTADLTIMEEGTELLMRLKKALQDKETVSLPMFTSCCPAWINFAEYYYSDMLPNLSSCKSPQQMFGAVAKTYYARKQGIRPEQMTVVSIMPCTAKKFECQRQEMIDSSVQDVDYVLTTRELGQMVKEAGIDFMALQESEMDAPLGLSSGAADIFANTGGVMEAALRTAYEIVTGRELPVKNLHVTPVTGLEGVKEASIVIEHPVADWSFLDGVEVKVAVSHGLANARSLIEHIESGEKSYHFIEVMACPGGCIGGGGQPRLTTDAVRMKRINAIYAEDEGKLMRKSHENEAVQQLYAEFLEQPLSEKSHHLLHTKYRGKPAV